MNVPDLTSDHKFLAEGLTAAIARNDQDDTDAFYRLLLRINPDQAIHIMATAERTAA